MKNIIFVLNFFMAIVAYGDTASTNAKLEKLTTTIYCYCGCSRETIQQCVCGVSHEIANDFREKLKNGETVEEIRNDYLAKHGTEFSALMPVEGINIIAYVTPFLILAALGFFAIHRLRRSKNKLVPVAKPIEASLEQQIEDEIARHRENR